MWQRVWLVLLPVLVAAGCAAAPQPAAAPAAPAVGPTRLHVELSRRPDFPPAEFALDCDPPAGSLPDPGRACAALLGLGADLFAPVPAGALCTQLYGGPDTVTVRGVFRGREVSTLFTRRNGCEIGRYDQLLQALGLAPR